MTNRQKHNPIARAGRIASLCLGLAIAVGQLSGPSMAAGKSPTVVELFTSQGCSSCPPADAFLGDLVKRKDVIALTFPVDYWDYLGWKDTLASPSNTKRQRAYAKARGDRQVYTPQMVINGRYHAIGSYRTQVEGKITQVSRDPQQLPVQVSLTSDKDTITVDARDPGGTAAGKRATLWLILTRKKATVSIKRGENTGRKITYYNVVRQMLPIGQWTGGKLNVKLPKSELIAQGYDGCTALLQVNRGGPILGVAHIDNWKM